MSFYYIFLKVAVLSFLFFFCANGISQSNKALANVVTNNQFDDKNSEDTKTRRRILSRIDIPATWQVTKAEFPSSGALMQTETFEEIWYLEVKPEGQSFLISPRAKVNVLRTGNIIADGFNIPQSLLLFEKDFAKLVGIKKKPTLPQDTEPLEDKLVNVKISLESLDGSDVVLRLTDNEHYAIHIKLGPPKL